MTQWTAIDNVPVGFFPLDLTQFNGNAWLAGFTASEGGQLYKLGNDGSVTKWTALNTNGGGLFSLLTPNQVDLTVFNNALWFTGLTANEGFQLYKLGADDSVTQWTAVNPGNGGLFAQDLTVFNNALWFRGETSTESQLYKLGNDGSVTKWTTLNSGGSGLDPSGFKQFSDALWFNGMGPDGNQLYKLGADGSVTQWTEITNFDPGGANANGVAVFNNALWFEARSPDSVDGGLQLYKLGFDGSVTKWTAINTSGGGLEPLNMFVFANALWFSGATADGRQLFKLGADGSVTKWTDVPGGFDPQLVSQSANDPDSTPSSVFNNAAWLSATNPATGTELYKLGADGSVTFWKEINPGPPSSFPHDWAVLG